MNAKKTARWGLLLLTALLLIGTAEWSEHRKAVQADGDAALTASPPMVALTFDDGPRRDTTATLLDGLAERGVCATFFLVGKLLEENEALVRRMAAEGHQVGIHTYDHVWLTDLSKADFDREVDTTRVLLEGLLGEGDYYIRPPYGGVDAGVRQWADAPIILWSVDPEDWNDKNTPRIVEHILSHTKDGDIILLHDIYPTSVEAALKVVDALHAKGFLFVTVEELARSRGAEPRAGEVYRCFSP